MKNARSFPAVLAGATSIALLLSSSAFADSRQQDNGYGRDWQRQSQNSQQRGDNRNNSYRENDRVNVEGRITSFDRENNGYRVRIDRDNNSYWVPDSYVRNRARDLRVGVSITLGGVWRSGSVYVDNVGWPAAGYGGEVRDGFVRGVVDRVDRRAGAVWLRDDRIGRIIEVQLRNRNGRQGIDRLRRGDYVELSGGWTRNMFFVDRINTVRTGRY